VGVPVPALCEPLARVLQSLEVRRAMVVCGTVSTSRPETNPSGTAGLFLDELSSLGDNHIAEFYQERGLTASVMSPEAFPLQPASLSDLSGGDREANAGLVRQILSGDERGPKRDAVLLNAAAALFIAGAARNLMEGWDLAAATIDGGQAARKLAELVESS
jgi:anthranilate phosphoribosyltransferase